MRNKIFFVSLPERIFQIEKECLNETMIVKNEKKEEFAISAGSIAWYNERLSWFVAFQQTHHEGEAKQERKRRIFPLTSPYLGSPFVAAVYSFYFVRKITAHRGNCTEKVLICGSYCSQPHSTRYRLAFIWILLNFSSQDGEISWNHWWKKVL